MGQEEGIPEDVAAFLAAYIDSVPQLEALLLMHGSPAQAWTAEAMASRIYLPPDKTRALLLELARHKLLRQSDAGAWAFSPDPALAQRVGRVAEVYRRELVRVAGMIHSKASLGVREFARAFQLKKEP